jgi:hypothetical protein
MSELYIADTFVGRAGDAWRYVKEWDTWYEWRGDGWYEGINVGTGDGRGLGSGVGLRVGWGVG